MKKIKSYSLNEETINRISGLSESLGISESAVLEILVRLGYQTIDDKILKEIIKDENI